MKSDLISILKTLQSDDLKKIKLLIRNNLFCNNKNSYLLFEELCKYYPLFEIEKDDKLKIYKKIYGDILYHDSTFRSLIHSLLYSVEEYLVIQYYKRNAAERDLALLEEFKYRNIDKLLLKRLDKSKRVLSNNDEYFSLDVLQDKIKINNLLLNYSITNERILHKDTINEQAGFICKSSYDITLNYFIESVSRFAVLEVYKRTCNIDVPVNLNDNVNIVCTETLKEKFKYNKSVLSIIRLYESVYLMFLHFDDESNFHSYKKLIKKSKHQLSRDELTNHYYKIAIYCIIKKNNSGGSAFYRKELWNIYKEMLNNDLLIERENIYLDINLYRSILFLGLNLKLYEEINIFIEKYSKKINPADLVNILRLSYGYLYYEMGEYEKALDNATKIVINDFIFKYDIKNLLVKIYFDMGYWFQLESTLDSYKEFLRNDPILNPGIKLKIKLFISYIEFLTIYASEKDKIDVLFHYKKLQSEDVYNKDWLIEKYSEYLKLEHKYA